LTTSSPPDPAVDQLDRALTAVGDLVAKIQDNQWSSPTPCTEWTVRGLVGHLVGMNRVFVAMLNDQKPPTRGDDPLGDDPVAAYRDSSATLLETFRKPGILDRVYEGPLGSATGATRLRWRTADLLAHAWDLGEALGTHVDLPDGLVEQALVFVKTELPKQSRTGRFDEEQPVAEDSPAIERYVAFLGRKVNAH
jgi:uncharacterized protein (TIGR03086 family)